ncbi:TonB-dependent receptor domain-containing protein [Oceanihabitans sediminis]|uniref:TonB-dependent receptor n=1 Tax=Oceanihabitans sediminis TaxID=1812012 RepID=A0A368P567_9FLAO|nr:TonB-dependent receptor [Oceanihabitans sediminis]MDX1277529.1 TonB-dependent receptor [Oceanihabitans sediminis]MDX1773426.1 TonB-dependent receptor [Oceanihabitans sediminis]RBP32881.1 outer membrane receptor protein involved in Fe transport [Oceanihabitans sediminis]RCU57593.1 TonB-dependent receptor [Oceanihabitans sediminis]
MTRNLFVFICIAFFTLSSFAQKEIKVTGFIIEQDTQQPLEYATVAFFSKAENRMITGGITDQKGHFNIPVPVGLYDISVEFIGFGTKTIPNQNLTKNTNLKTIYLSEDAESLGEIEIIAERTTVEIKLDKKIYSVGKDLTVRGGTVSDVLDNVPSVAVDVEGNVSLRGQDNVRILINGKPSGLVGLNSTDALRQLPAESIEKVEVITSPSARYDSEGTAGILNIILKRSKIQGFNGAITTNAGYDPSAGISGNINYRTGDVNIFNTTGYSYREVPGSSYTNTTYKATGNTTEETREFERVRKGFNTNLGVEWYINDSASLTTSVFYRDSNNESNTTNEFLQFDNNYNLIGDNIRFDPEVEDDKTIQYAANFTKNFETSGHKLSFDFQYEDSTEDQNSLVTVDGLTSEMVEKLEDQSRILLQGDYVLPLGENAQFELGYRGNFNNQSTDYKVEILDEDTNDFVIDNKLSNLLNYKEYINAVYSQYGSKHGKFSYLLGLRLENTQVTIDQPTSGDFKKKNYTGLFPTVNLNYELTEDESVTLGYSRRLRRARSWFINPFPSRSSVTSIFQGNPDLDPSYSGTFDLGYINRFGKFMFNSSAYYQHATDVFNFVSFDTGETVVVNGEDVPVIQRTPINLSSEDRYGFEFTLSYRASRKFNTSANFNVFKSKSEGVDPNGVDLGSENTSWFARLNTKYTLPADIEWQTSMFYRGPSEDAQNKRDGVFSTNLAFSKDLLNDRASIAFNVSDLFNSRKRIMDTNTDTFISSSEFQWRKRSFNLSFTYRFNQQKKRERTRGNGGDEMEFEG